MLTMGIDIGSHFAKGVLLKEKEMVASTAFRINTDPLTVFDKLIKDMPDASDVGIDDTIVTGVGGQFLSDKYRFFPELVCHALGIHAGIPTVRTVMAVGSENFSVGRVDADGNLVDFGTNDKCAAGSGIFIEEMAGALRIGIAEMGELALRATQDLNMSATCTVFMESEVVSMNHKKIPRKTFHGPF